MREVPDDSLDASDADEEVQRLEQLAGDERKLGQLETVLVGVRVGLHVAPADLLDRLHRLQDDELRSLVEKRGLLVVLLEDLVDPGMQLGVREVLQVRVVGLALQVDELDVAAEVQHVPPDDVLFFEEQVRIRREVYLAVLVVAFFFVRLDLFFGDQALVVHVVDLFGQVQECRLFVIRHLCLFEWPAAFERLNY